MKNIIYLLLAIIILFISACNGQEYTFQGSNFESWPVPALNFDAGSIITPTQHTECELMPQFSFEKDEAMEIVIECEEITNY